MAKVDNTQCGLCEVRVLVDAYHKAWVMCPLIGKHIHREVCLKIREVGEVPDILVSDD